MNLGRTRKYNHDNIKELLRIYKVLLLLNEYGDLPFSFQNLSSYKINNQWVKFKRCTGLCSAGYAQRCKRNDQDDKTLTVEERIDTVHYIRLNSAGESSALQLNRERDRGFRFQRN